MKVKILIPVILVLMGSVSLQLSAQVNSAAGSWLGSLDVGAVKLRLVFNISENEDGTLSATMDSPDQGAKGIAMGKVSFTGDSLVIEAPMILGVYKGQFEASDSINGQWTQGGRTFDLDLVRQVQEFVLNRPQEPQGPFPYKEEEVTFSNINAGIDLAGTITLPEGEGPFPGLILVTGSGSQNRDEEIFGHKPFKVIADYLTRRGFAVLRYNDRGVPPSGGTAAGATSRDLAGDARAALVHLKAHTKVDGERVGILGHSEGGLIAQFIAAETDEAAFIIMLAGPGTAGRDVLLDQSEYISRANGLPEATIMLNSKINGGIYDLLEQYEDQAEGINNITAYVRSVLAEAGTGDEIIEQVASNIKAEMSPAAYPWLRCFVMADPADLLPDIDVPILAINGDKDCQVIADINLPVIDSLLAAAGHKDYETINFPDLNHLFQHCITGLTAEYGEIEETISPEVLYTIADWLEARFK